MAIFSEPVLAAATFVLGFVVSRCRIVCWVGLHGTVVTSSASNRRHCSICGKFMAK